VRVRTLECPTLTHDRAWGALAVTGALGSYKYNLPIHRPQDNTLNPVGAPQSQDLLDAMYHATVSGKE